MVTRELDRGRDLELEQLDQGLGQPFSMPPVILFLALGRKRGIEADALQLKAGVVRSEGLPDGAQLRQLRFKANALEAETAGALEVDALDAGARRWQQFLQELLDGLHVVRELEGVFAVKHLDGFLVGLT